MKVPKIYLIDVDKTLCKEVCFTSEECLKATPIKEAIDKVNSIMGFIIIYTARTDKLMEATIKWLKKVGVSYHAISNIKIPGDYYVDDNSLKIKDL